MSGKQRARIAAIAIVIAMIAYVSGYGGARVSHRLVRYESSCVARGDLEGRGRDLWNWPYRCGELRRSLPPSGWEAAYAPFIALEEAARDQQDHRDSRPSICTLPNNELPSQAFSRPAWCMAQ